MTPRVPKSMKITGQNFQSHESFDMELKGLTVLIGPSNQGKSAVLRAIKGLVRNEISEGHVRVGSKKLELTAEIEGHTVHAERKSGPKGSVTYKIDGEDFAKLNGEVPKPLLDLNLGRIELGEVKLDPIFARQGEKQFLLEELPSTLNAILGAFSATEQLEQGKREANARVVNRNAEAKVLATDVQTNEALKANLDRLCAEADELQQAVEALQPTVDALERTVTQLDLLIASKRRHEALQDMVLRTYIPSAFVESAFHTYEIVQGLSHAVEAQTAHARLTAVLKALVVPDVSEAQKALAVMQNAGIAATARERYIAAHSLQEQIDDALTDWSKITTAWKTMRALQEAIAVLEAPGAEVTKAIAQKLNESLGVLEAGFQQAVTTRQTVIWINEYITRTAECMQTAAQVQDTANEIDVLALKEKDIRQRMQVAERAAEKAAEAKKLITCPKCGENFDPSVPPTKPQHIHTILDEE